MPSHGDDSGDVNTDLGMKTWWDIDDNDDNIDGQTILSLGFGNAKTNKLTNRKHSST